MNLEDGLLWWCLFTLGIYQLYIGCSSPSCSAHTPYVTPFATVVTSGFPEATRVRVMARPTATITAATGAVCLCRRCHRRRTCRWDSGYSSHPSSDRPRESSCVFCCGFHTFGNLQYAIQRQRRFGQKALLDHLVT